jgi:hypothetical protein
LVSLCSSQRRDQMYRCLVFLAPSVVGSFLRRILD